MSDLTARCLQRSFASMLAAVAIGGLFGCGGSSKTDPNPASTTSQASAHAAPTSAQPSSTATTALATRPQNVHFLAAAEAVCKRLNERIKATEPKPTDSKSDIASNSLQHAALEQAAAQKLSKLRPSPQFARDWAQIVRYRQSLAQGLVQLGHDIKSGNTAGIATLATSKKSAHTAMSEIARRDGFKECASIGSAS